MTRLRANSRAASVPKENTIVTEISDGLIISKPAKRIEHLSTRGAKSTSERQTQDNGLQIDLS